MAVRELSDADRAWARLLIDEVWGLPVVSVSGVHDDPGALPGFVAEGDDGEPVGLLTYRVDEVGCEVVVLLVTEEGRGHGRALMEAVREVVQGLGARRLWLSTTDDNIGAQRFYARLGMREVARHRDFVEVVRRSKLASTGYRDAIEFEWP